MLYLTSFYLKLSSAHIEHAIQANWWSTQRVFPLPREWVRAVKVNGRGANSTLGTIDGGICLAASPVFRLLKTSSVVKWLDIYILYFGVVSISWLSVKSWFCDELWTLLFHVISICSFVWDEFILVYPCLYVCWRSISFQSSHKHTINNTHHYTNLFEAILFNRFSRHVEVKLWFGYSQRLLELREELSAEQLLGLKTRIRYAARGSLFTASYSQNNC